MFDQIAQTIPYQQITVEGFEISIKRLDLVHPHISGNKFFKLKYNLLSAQQQGYKKLLTFGGADNRLYFSLKNLLPEMCGWTKSKRLMLILIPPTLMC